MFLIPLPFMPYCTPRCSWWRCDCSCTEGNILRPAKTLGSELTFPSNLSERRGCGELLRPSRVHQEKHVTGRVGLETAAECGFPPPPPQTPAGPRILHVLRELSPGPTQEGWDGIRHRGAEDLRHHIYLWPWEARHEQIDYYSDTSGFKSQEQGLIIKTWEVQL